ncbi:serine/threonine-protein kinase [Demequina sp. NBRC 110057]|uniref:serine/threonine-protein kinase n=1 Tax=Demequina sp. NBRC 110057 TaxID=1570346 RepID=UPI00135670FC|nr:serine/threonine-protein kinase [Demequina sp. NBRC 110057]
MAAAAREPGDEIGGYRIVDQLGRGGSGAVYKVVDGGGAEAALKLVDARADEVAALRLEREVHALQSLKHPALPSILDAELDGDETFVVFEYIPGKSLWDHVQDEGPMRGDALADVADRTASALEAVHASGVIHRDVTPSNIMMGPDGPVLIDFGLSHRATDDRLTRDGLVSGTAGYVAPEVIDGEEPGAVADQWSWAATIAYAALGRAPFGSGTGAISKTLEAKVELPAFPGSEALTAALGRDIGARPGPRDVVAALRGATTVLPRSGDLEPTMVAGMAPTAVMGATRGDDAVDTFITGSEADPTEQLSWTGDDLDEAGHHGDGQDDDAAFDDVLTSDEVEVVLPPAPRRKLVIATLAVATGSAAAFAPFIAFLFMVVCAVIVRGVQRRALGLATARARRGQRRGDAALQTIGLPWHILRAAGEALPSILLAAVVGVGVGALGWWLVSSETVAPGTVEGQSWGHAVVLVLAALAAEATLWWGPWAALTREGAHRVTAAVSPSRGPSTVWVIVGVAAIAVMTLVILLLVDPLWWPLPDLPA